jgi:Zn-dependent alcohol dehydrogenase
MKMKAAVLYGANQPLRVEDVTLDDPQDHEVMVRLVATGICHSDLLLMKGEVPTQYPVVAGHEGAGVVEKVGRGVVSVQPGDHVVLPAIFSCGKCRPCIQGQPTLCLETLPAHLMGGLPGGGKRLHNDKGDINVFYSQGSFAEHVIVHESSAIKVRSDAPPEVVCLFSCRITTGVGAVSRRAGVRPGESVAIFGCGAVGLGAVMGARLCGAGQIIVVDLVEERLEMARQLGASHIINASRDNPQQKVFEITGGGADYALECIGNTKVMMQAFSCLNSTGTLVIAGAPPAADMVSFYPFEFLFGKTVKGTFLGNVWPRIEIPRLVELFMRGELPLDRLAATSYRLEQINDAIEAVDKAAVMRAVIRF